MGVHSYRSYLRHKVLQKNPASRPGYAVLTRLTVLRLPKNPLEPMRRWVVGRHLNPRISASLYCAPASLPRLLKTGLPHLLPEKANDGTEPKPQQSPGPAPLVKAKITPMSPKSPTQSQSLECTMHQQGSGSRVGSSSTKALGACQRLRSQATVPGPSTVLPSWGLLAIVRIPFEQSWN